MRQLNVHRIVTDLNLLCEQLERDYNINRGACCYVAYVIAKHLDKFHIKYNLQVTDCYSKNEDGINREVQQRMKNTCGEDSVVGMNTCIHYYLNVSGGGNVNEGEPDDDEIVYTITEVNHRNIGWIYKHGSWNRCYKRKNNKLIKNLISSYFRQYGKSRKTSLLSREGNNLPAMQIRC